MAPLTKSATRGCPRANLSKSFTRGASWTICPNQPLGVLTDHSAQISRQGGAPQPICPNWPPGGARSILPISATRGHFWANIPQIGHQGPLKDQSAQIRHQGDSQANLPKLTTRVRSHTIMHKSATWGPKRTILPKPATRGRFRANFCMS